MKDKQMKYKMTLAMSICILIFMQQAKAMEVVAGGGSIRNTNLESKLSSKLAALAAIVEAMGRELKSVRECSIEGEYYDTATRTCKRSVLGEQVQTNEDQLTALLSSVEIAKACNRDGKNFNWDTNSCMGGNGKVPTLTFHAPYGGFPASTGSKNIGFHHVCSLYRASFREDGGSTDAGSCGITSGAEETDGKRTWYLQNGRRYWAWMQCHAICMDWND